MDLLEHRQHLAANPSAYTQDIPRLYKTVVSHLKKCGYSRITQKRCPDLIKNYVDLIFQTQHNLPFFHIAGDLPYCWNSPGDWHFNYIRYQWGHLQSRNLNDTPDFPENLCLQSARCNLHVQTSMNIDEVIKWLDGSAVSKRAREVLKRRASLFQSEAWEELISKLSEYQ